jgi:hypothetical protein
MRVDVLGEGEARHAIVGSIHGDEVCGKKIIDEVRTEFSELQRSVKCIVAHTEALEEETSYIDENLNRSFPGAQNDDVLEKRLAAQILDQVKGYRILDLHSTVSQSEPFAIVPRINHSTKLTTAATGVSSVVDISDVDISGSLIQQTDGVSVECGKKGTEMAVQNGINVVRNFLAVNNLIDKPGTVSNPTVYRLLESVEHPPDSACEFLWENFSLVPEGETYAYVNGEEKTADMDFYPVLMSEDGYSGMLGFKAMEVGSMFKDEEFQKTKQKIRGEPVIE